jgi:hypothetical protein
MLAFLVPYRDLSRPIHYQISSAWVRQLALRSYTGVSLQEFQTMSICHEHNLATPPKSNNRYGVRVRLRSTDPFRNLVGSEWNKEHWYATAKERDDALADMSGRYVYFRPGDKPALTFDKLDK